MNLLRIKHIVLIGLVSLSSITVIAQPTVSHFENSQADSLKKILSSVTSDKDRLELLRQISWSYAWSLPDSALKYSQEGLKLAEQMDLPESKVNLLTVLAQAYSGKGNLSQALKTNFIALDLAEKLRNEELAAWSYASIGSIYFYAEDYQNALDYFIKTKIYPAVYNSKKKLYTAFIGETYFHLNQFDSALLYTKQSYDLQTRSTGHWSVPYLYMGKLSENKGLYQEAISFYHASIKENVPESDSIKAYLSIANNFKKRNLTDSGIYYAKRAFSIAQHAELYRYTFDASLVLKDLYKTSIQHDSAFKYQEIMLAARDSLFNNEKLKQLQSISFDEQQRRQEIEKEKEKLRDKIKMYGLIAGLVVLAIIALILLRSNRFKQKTNMLLQKQKKEIDDQRAKVENALVELKATQSQLIQSEKMASLGELTAGIAHEIQNPLNFVNNFSEVSNELIDEMKIEFRQGDGFAGFEIADEIKQNLEKINHHGKRAADIVKGMLQHSRTGTGQKELTDINNLADEYLRLSYHGLRAKDKSFNANIKIELDPMLPKVNVVPQDIGRVLLNLINNAFYAVNEKKSETNLGYDPTVTVATKAKNGSVEIRVKDNGNGIPQKVLDKIFQPFFTTKPTGQGTGLGLSLSYDIVKAHGGELKVETKEGEGSEFIISLPVV
jgi:signal transduction histidine kinase